MARPDTFTHRLGNVLYWLCILLGAIPTLILASEAPFLHDKKVTTQILNEPWYLPAALLILLLPVIIGYIAGWTMRYLLTGRTDY